MNFLVSVIFVILSLAVGILLLGVSLNLAYIAVIYRYLGGEIIPEFPLKLVLALIGMLLILFCLKYIQTLLRHSRKNKAIAFESPQGEVSITLFAIEDMLKKMLEERTEVTNVKARVFLRKKWIEVVASGVLTAEVNLVDFTKEIQEKVKEKMHILLGEDKQVKVNLEIKKVSVGSKKRPDEQEPEVPFRNYE